MQESLNPSLRERISRLLRPDFTRTIAARRTTAGVLVVIAAAAALWPDVRDGYTDVVVAAADLSPGTVLGGDTVRLEKHSAATIPDGVVTGIAAVDGLTLAGPARRGEVLTDARVLGSRLTGLAAGPDARVVPLHLADSAVLDVIRPGDLVDVLGAPASGGEGRPRLLAASAVVVLVPAAGKPTGGERVVLIALPAAVATAVAAASLVQSLTLTIH